MSGTTAPLEIVTDVGGRVALLWDGGSLDAEGTEPTSGGADPAERGVPGPALPLLVGGLALAALALRQRAPR